MSQTWAEREESILRVHLLPMLGMAKLKDLKAYHLQDIINQMAQSGKSTSTMKKVKQTAARIMETALERDLIMRNVFSKVKVPSVEPKERRALSEDEKALLTATWEKHRMGLPAMIMMYCGLRRGEVLALRWNDIDIGNKVLHVNKSVELFQNQPRIKKPKSKAGLRDVPIPNILIDILNSAPHTYPLVCPDAKGCLMTDMAYRRAWNSYRSFLNSEAGGHPGRNHVERKQVLDNITAHMLRHTYASTLYDAGVDIKSAQIFLGHANIELTLEVYTHLSQFKKDEAISSLNAHLDKYASEMRPASSSENENADAPKTQE